MNMFVRIAKSTLRELELLITAIIADKRFSGMRKRESGVYAAIYKTQLPFKDLEPLEKEKFKQSDL